MVRFLPWLYALAGGLALFALAWWLPVQVPRSITVPGRVLPVQEWLLTREATGELAATLRDHQTGAVVSYFATEIDRGDALEFNLISSVLRRGYVSAGDTVGLLSSSEVQQRLTQLQGELATSEALLRETLAGEKEAVIDEARQQHLQAQEQVELQRRLVERQRQLAAQDLLAPELLEQSETQLRLYELGVAAAAARLEALRTGSRPEEIARAQAQVQALRNELRAHEQRLALSTLTTPISGPILHAPAPDTLLTVLDTTGYVVTMPLVWFEQNRVRTGQAVRVAVPGWSGTGDGTITHVGAFAWQVQQQPFVMVTARLNENVPGLVAGLHVQCTIPLPGQPLREVLRQVLRDLFIN